MSKVAIIDYGAGNVQNVRFALERLGVEPILSRNPEEIQTADRVLFPGVGHAAHAMESLREYGLVETIQHLEQPVLGICLGMQVMCNHSEEGNVDCLGIFDVNVGRFKGVDKVPHMGWNRASVNPNQPEGTNNYSHKESGNWYYFVHSYKVPVCDETWLIANYGSDFSAGLKKENFWAVQFHPEKSGLNGEELIREWLEWNP